MSLEQRFRSAIDLLTSLGAERALVLFDRGAGLEVALAHGLDPETVWTAAPISLGVLERVKQEGAPLLVADAQEGEQLESSFSLMLSGIRAVLCVPFKGPEGKVVGLLYGDNRMHTGAFEPTDLLRVVACGREIEACLGTPAAPAPRAAGQRVEQAPPVVSKKEKPAAIEREKPAAVERKNPAAAAPGKPASRTVARKASSLSGKPTAQGRAVFFRSLATMLEAGITIQEALDLLENAKDDPAMAAIAGEVAREVQTGQTLSRAMSLYPQAFSQFHLRLVATGERSGKLTTVLSELADNEERNQAAIMQLKSALTYPAIIMALCTVMLVLAPPYLLEGHFQLIRSSGVEPPLLTKMVMTLSHLVSSPLFLLASAVCGLGVGFCLKLVLAQPQGRLAFTRLLMNLPGIGRVLWVMAISRFARVLALQIKSGILLSEALERAGSSSLNPVLEHAMPRGVERLKEGGSLVNSLEETGFFPRTFVEMARVGEETGQLEQMMEWIAQIYEQELEATLDSFAAMLEPLVMLVMGFIVGIMLIATMLPLVKALNTL